MCLDYLHHGHINILKKANNYGKVIVGLMTDKAIIAYKEDKPIINFNNRKKIAMSIKYVKKVLAVKKLDFVPIAKKYKFDYILHGDDWKSGRQKPKRKNLINAMKNWKGKVIDIKYTRNISSTLIKKKLRKKK